MKIPTLHIPLAAPGFLYLRMAQTALGLLTLMGPLLAVWFWAESGTLEQAALHYEQATARTLERIHDFGAKATMAGYQLTEDRLESLGREVAFANQVLAKRAFSWTRLLTDLEEAVPKRVSLGSVRLNFKDSIITLQGAARTIQDLIALVNSLEDHPAFRNVVLAQHHFREESRPGSGKTSELTTSVSFSLTVDYRTGL